MDTELELPENLQLILQTVRRFEPVFVPRYFHTSSFRSS